MGRAIEISELSKRFGETKVLRDINLEIHEGELLTLLGPSGCGKSTLLRLIAGFEMPDRGEILMDGRSVLGHAPKARGVSMVFQSYALYPHMSVYQNIAMPLVMAHSRGQRLPLVGQFWPGARAALAEVDAQVRRVADMVEISALLDRKPAALSGGQRQRVALARAVVRRPTLFLMDEPLSNLDAKLRVQMRRELVSLNRRLGVPFLYVTHDQTEAMTMSDRVAVMMDGRILQCAPPAEIYRAPAHLKVAQFIGLPSINLFPGEMRQNGYLEIAGVSDVRLRVDTLPGPVQIAIRPEALTIGGKGPTFQARPAHVELLGAEALVWVEPLGGTGQVAVQIRAEALDVLRANGGLTGTLSVAIGQAGLHVFGADGAVCPLVNDTIPRLASEAG